jgi:hypothetical protein
MYATRESSAESPRIIIGLPPQPEEAEETSASSVSGWLAALLPRPTALSTCCGYIARSIPGKRK